MSIRLNVSHAIAVCVVVLATVAISPARADTGTLPAVPATSKIGVVDTERIMVLSVIGKKAMAEIKQMQATSETQLKLQQQEIATLNAKLSAGVSGDQHESLMKEVREKTASFQQAQESARSTFNKRRTEILAAVDAKVMPVITQLGKEMSFTVIFRKYEAGLVYADESIDISNVVIQRLNAAEAAAVK